MKFPEYTQEVEDDLANNPINSWWYYEIGAGGPPKGRVMYISGQSRNHALNMYLRMTDVPHIDDGLEPKYIPMNYLLRDSPFLYLGRGLDWLFQGKASWGGQVVDIELLRHDVVIKTNGRCVITWWRDFLLQAETIVTSEPKPVKPRTVWDRIK